MSWHVSLWIYPVWDSLCFLDLTDYLFSHISGVFNYNLFKYFSVPFFFSSSSGSPIIRILVHLMLSQRSLTVLNSFHSFIFILLCGSYFHYFIFLVTYPFFSLSYPAIGSLWRILNFIYFVVHHCLFTL